MKAYVIVVKEFMGEAPFFPVYKTKERAKDELKALVDKLQEGVNKTRDSLKEHGMDEWEDYKDFQNVSEDLWTGDHFNMTEVYIKEIEVI